jgi:hypothetical protein
MVKDHSSSLNQKCWEWYQKEGGDDLLSVFELIFKSISFVILTGCYMGIQFDELTWIGDK